MRTRSSCFPGARVPDVSAQIPAILKGEEKVGSVMLHAWVNDTKLRQTETLKRDFRGLIKTVHSTQGVCRTEGSMRSLGSPYSLLPLQQQPVTASFGSICKVFDGLPLDLSSDSNLL